MITTKMKNKKFFLFSKQQGLLVAIYLGRRSLLSIYKRWYRWTWSDILAVYSPERGIGFTKSCGIEIGVLAEHFPARDAGGMLRTCGPGRACLYKGRRFGKTLPLLHGMFLPEHHGMFDEDGDTAPPVAIQVLCPDVETRRATHACLELWLFVASSIHFPVSVCGGMVLL